MFFGWFKFIFSDGFRDAVEYCCSQIAPLEDKRNQVLRGIIGVQKYFRGYLARRHFHQIKEDTTKLQSSNAYLFF